MTDREKAIVMAYTGICMLTGDKLVEYYSYLEELYGRPVYTHEWSFLDIREKSKKDFLELCQNTSEEEVIRCKDCKHKPTGTGVDHDIEFPDNVCPCQCEDYWYSWMPQDNFFCAFGERREE